MHGKMEILRSVLDLPSETMTLSEPAPRTPPYTPHRAKRRLERSDSPASSIHPAETCSPAKKIVKRTASDHVKVEELVEGDLGYQSDIESIYPEELEEAASNSDGDDEMSSSDSDGPDEAITRRLSRLSCGELSEVDFEKERRRRHVMRRAGEKAAFKRSHSQSVKSDTDVTTDPDAMDDQDLIASRRRLRRRVHGPREAEEVLEDVPRSSPEVYTTKTATNSRGDLTTPPSMSMEPVAFTSNSDVMDVDMSSD